MNKFFLNLMMLPSGLWRSLGADTTQLRAILDVRLKMDDRKPINFGRQRNAQKKDRKNGVLLNIFISGMLGGFYAFMLMINDRVLSLTLYFTMFLTLLLLTLISDFSTVLFDTRDKFIILPRPVSDRTIVLSRLLHILIYLIRIVLPMSAVGWVALGIMDGWKSAVLFPFILLLLVLTALFFMNLCYLLILKLAKPERFKEVISYFQIAASIIFFGCIYLLPRAFDNGQMNNLQITNYPWIRYLPSYWLASCWQWIGFQAPLAGSLYLSILAVVFPLICLFVLIKWLAPQFARAIGGLDVDYSAAPATVKNVQVKGTRFYQKLAYLVNRNDASRAGFMLTWLQTSRSRTFKMRVYPSLAFVPIYFVYMITSNRRHSIGETFHHMPETSLFIPLLYMSSFVVIQSLNYLNISEQYKASWVYYAMPVEKPGKILAGAFKVVWLKFFFPFFAALSIYTLCVWGPATIIDIVLALVNVTLFAVCIARVSYLQFPFSQLGQMNQGANRFIRSFVSMIIPVALGFGHYAALHMLWLKLVFLVLSAIFFWLVWDSYVNTSWEAMQKSNNEL